LYLFVAETPLQALSVLAYRATNKLETQECDLLIHDHFKLAESIYTNIKQLNLFAHVYKTEGFYLDSRHATASALVRHALLKGRTRKIFAEATGIPYGKTYERLVCSGFTQLTLDAKFVAVPNGQTSLIDDGSGSHNGVIYSSNSFAEDIIADQEEAPALRSAPSLIRNELQKARLQYLSYSTRDLSLFNCSFRTFELIDSVPLYELDIRQVNFATLEKVFPDARTFPLDRKIIYFALPLNAGEQVLAFEDELLKGLDEKYGKNLCIMLHPRSSRERFAYIKNASLLEGYFWEAVLATGLIDESYVLLGMFSTAQITPKMLFNLEPQVLFSSKMLNDPSWRFDADIELLKAGYEHEDRVAAPCSVEEYAFLLDSFVMKQ
jgi:hypothetical protein